MRIAIIKYNAGNSGSVLFALERLGVKASITDDPMEILTADKVIFPGVGEASSAMRYLTEKRLDEVILSLRQPVLGICLGMQLMCRRSEEGNTQGLGIFDIDVKKFTTGLKVPQVGWNDLANCRGKLFERVGPGKFMYFVHSYYAEVIEGTVATANYGLDFSAALNKNNFYGVQFHPEKSGEAGETLLNNFINI